MTISYPLSMPSTHRTRMNMRPLSSIGMSSNPFNFKMQVQDHSGQIMAFEVTLPTMQRNESDADEWISFCLNLKGRYGTFLLGDNTRKIPRGLNLGTPLVDGTILRGSQTLSVKGMDPNTTGNYLNGDYFQIGSRLYRLCEDLDSDGSGEGEVQIFPRVREEIADEEPIITTNPVGLFRMVSNENVFAFGVDQNVDIAFIAAEAL